MQNLVYTSEKIGTNIKPIGKDRKIIFYHLGVINFFAFFEFYILTKITFFDPSFCITLFEVV